MRLVLLGPPGSGKGTQAALLAEREGVPHISTGAILRANIEAGTQLGRLAAERIDRGDFVPDDVAVRTVQERLAEPDCKAGVLLDGFPRTVPQAEVLHDHLSVLGTPLSAALELRVDDQEELLRRLLDRAEREGRADDTEAVIRHRFGIYDRVGAPLVEYYRAHGLLRSVDGVGTVDAVATRVRKVLAG